MERKFGVEAQEPKANGSFVRFRVIVVDMDMRASFKRKTELVLTKRGL